MFSIILSINPSFDVPSSLDVSKIANLKFRSSEELRKSFEASINAATDPFMSATPLPYSRSSSIVAEKGGYFHFSSGPLGTTSV